MDGKNKKLTEWGAMPSPLEFLDDSGTTLTGFSQIDLEALNKNIEKNNELLMENKGKLEQNRNQLKHLTTATMAGVIMASGFLLYLIWLTVYIISNNIFNNALSILGG